MDKLNFYVKVSPIILNLDKLENKFTAYATNNDNGERYPLFEIVKKQGVKITYFSNELDNRIEYNLEKIEGLLVIPYKILNNKIQLEKPILIETRARANELILTPFKISYSNGNLLNNTFYLTPPHFSVTVNPPKYLETNKEIVPEKVKLVSFYGKNILIVTSDEIFVKNVFEDLEWLIRIVKEIGTRKREADKPYGISFEYTAETLGEELVLVRQELDYLTPPVDKLNLELLVVDRDFLELTYYLIEMDLIEVTEEEAEVLRDIKGFRNYIKENLTYEDYFGADFILKKEFIEKYSPEIYNTLLESISINGNDNILQSLMNRLEIQRLVSKLDKLNLVTFKFQTRLSIGDNKIRVSLGNTDEEGEETVTFTVYKRQLMEEDTLILFYKDEFHFVKALGDLTDTTNLRNFCIDY